MVTPVCPWLASSENLMLGGICRPVADVPSISFTSSLASGEPTVTTAGLYTTRFSNAARELNEGTLDPAPWQPSQVGTSARKTSLVESRALSSGRECWSSARKELELQAEREVAASARLVRSAALISQTPAKRILGQKIANEGPHLSLPIDELGDQRGEQISFRRQIDPTAHESFVKLLNGAAIELSRIHQQFSEAERPDRSIATSSEER